MANADRYYLYARMVFFNITEVAATAVFKSLLMKLRYLVLHAIFYASLAVAQTKELDSFMQAALHAQVFNGVVLVARHDSILLHKGYGYRDINKKILHDSNSVFQIGSVTKSFTAACIMQQVEQGSLKLDDPLGKFFPFYTAGANVTIRQLLNHTAGIFECGLDLNFMESIYTGHLTEAAFWARFGYKPLDFTPGTQFKYSNTGYMILGYLLQKVSGHSYWWLVREGIFKPAGMTHSGFDFAGNKSTYRSTGYEYLYRVHPEQARVVDSSYSFSAGAVYSTSGDLYRYKQALLNEKIVSAASLKIMFTPVLSFYGFGWVIDSVFKQQTIVHRGAIPGFFSLVATVPGEQLTIILLGNKRDDGILLDPIYMSLLQLLHNVPYLLPRLTMKLPPEMLATYSGEYILADNHSFAGHLSIREGHIFIQWNTDKPIELFAEKPDLFFATVFDMQLSFSRDASNTIAGFTASVGGKNYVYKKSTNAVR